MRGRRECVAAFVLVAAAPAIAGEHLVRTVDWRSGAPMASVSTLDQDRDGFLWLATPQGLIRYDGAELRVLDREPSGILAGCAGAGRILTMRSRGADVELAELDGDRLVTIPLPENGREAGPVESGCCGDDGALWMVLAGELWRKAVDAPWTRVARERRWNALWPGRRGRVLGSSGGVVVRVAPDGAVEPLARLHRCMWALEREDGALAALDWSGDVGHVLVARDGAVRDLRTVPGRPMMLVDRRGTLWASSDAGLYGAGADGSRIDIPGSPTLFGGGPLLVDREGALWVGTPRGLAQFPEPETSGLDPPTGGRWLHRFPEGMFASDWRGARRVVENDGRFELALAYGSIGAVCRDARGRTWGVGFDGLSRTDASGRPTDIAFDHVGDMAPCALDASGTLWMPTHRGLLRLARDDDHPSVEPLPGSEPVYSVLLDHEERLFVGTTGRVCASEASSSRTWSCEPVPGAGLITDLLETDGGRVWAASSGVFERGGDGTWRRLSLEPGVTLPPTVSGLAASPRGGVWLLGSGALLRVAARAPAGRMEILERLGSWQGMPTHTTFDAFEESDGALWIAADAAIVRVPPNARGAPDPPARVALTSLRVDGEALPLDRGFRLPFGRNRLEVRVSAFSYRDPALVRYRFRMRDGDPWSEPTATPLFQLYSVSSGRYSMRFAASLDGTTWTETAAPLSFRIERPWFLQAWFFALVGIALAAVAWSVHRARVGRLVALERQRSRIAMDLHDAIGSGLGSIGLLAGVGSQASTGADKRREISSQVANMASELGMSLSEIVWSLDRGSERIEALAEYLSERANRLFVDDRVRVVREFPETWPDVPLSLPLRRNLLLIAVEALHNAARHAEAREVRLGIACAGTRWTLWVEDDGVGIDRGVSPGGGMGLQNVRRRAAEIGARLEWSPGTTRGTRVSVVFDPRSGA